MNNHESTQLVGCPFCNAANLPGGKFCQQCGRSMDPTASSVLLPSSLIEEKKIVTVLFADVSGFTKISEGMAPEDVRDIMNKTFAAISSQIESFGGRIDKYIGDCVMAIFGLPISYEDDAAKAVKAALNMQKVLHGLKREMKDTYQVSINMRVGINTGKVMFGLVGGQGTSSYTVMGDTVNLASRLEAFCPEGSVLISSETFNQVKGDFSIRQLKPIKVKGKKNPIPICEVLAECTPWKYSEPVLGGELLGREKQLQLIQQVYKQAVKNSEVAAVLVRGRPGVGKSRLLKEVLSRISQEGNILILYSDTGGSGAKPFQVLKNLLMGYCGAVIEDNQKTVAEKLQERLLIDLFWRPKQQIGSFTRPRPGTQEYAKVKKLTSIALALLFNEAKPGEEKANTISEEYLYLLDQIFSSLAFNIPIIIEVPKIHLIDELTLKSIKKLICMLKGKVLFLLESNLHGKIERLFADQISQNMKIIRLRRLDNNTINTIASKIIGRLSGSDAKKSLFIRFLAELAQGNPFYLEQFVQTMHDRKIIRQENNKSWSVNYKAAMKMKLPPKIQVKIQAEIDSIQPAPKAFLQVASVFEPTFLPQAVFALSELKDCQQIFQYLNERELLQKVTQTTFPDQDDYCFSDKWMRNILYDSLLARQREELHYKIVKWLEEKNWNHFTAYWLMLASHLKKIGDVTESADKYVKAAQLAHQQGQPLSKVLLYYRQARELLPGQESQWKNDKNKQLEISGEIINLLIKTGQLEKAETELVKMADITRLQGGKGYQGQVELLRGDLWQSKGNLARAEHFFHRGLEIFHQAGLWCQKTETLLKIGRLNIEKGYYEEALQPVLQALDLSSQRDDSKSAEKHLVEIYTFLVKISDNLSMYEDMANYACVGLEFAQKENNFQAGLDLQISSAMAQYRLNNWQSAADGFIACYNLMVNKPEHHYQNLLKIVPLLLDSLIFAHQLDRAQAFVKHGLKLYSSGILEHLRIYFKLATLDIFLLLGNITVCRQLSDEIEKNIAREDIGTQSRFWLLKGQVVDSDGDEKGKNVETKKLTALLGRAKPGSIERFRLYSAFLYLRLNCGKEELFLEIKNQFFKELEQHKRGAFAVFYHFNYGRFLFQKGNLISAQAELEVAFRKTQETGKKELSIDILFYMANLAINQSQREQSLNYLHQALEIVSQQAGIIEDNQVRTQYLNSPGKTNIKKAYDSLASAHTP